MQEKIQVPPCLCIPKLLQNHLIQRESWRNPKRSEPEATEKAPFLLLNFQVSSPETFYSSSLLPHIYISQKLPDSYDFLIRYERDVEEWGEKQGMMGTRFCPFI